MKESWMWDRMRQVHIDFHMPEFPKDAIKNFNAKETVAELVRAKVNMAAVFCKCHFGNSFYPTKVGHKHSGLKEDYFGEMLEEAHNHDIKVLAYYSLGTDQRAVLEHNDWYQVDENGKVRDGGGTVWQLPCMNSPYREELVLPQVREIAEMYDIDGMFLDIPFIYHHYCFCMYCKRKFNLEYGIELTPELLVSQPALVKGFGRDSAIRCLEEIRSAVKSIKPDALIGANGAWKMGEPRRFGETSDYGVWESQPAAGSYLYHSIKSRYVRELDVPVQVMTVRFTEGWGLMSCKTAEQLQYEAAAIMANGGTLNIGDQVMTDGTLQKGVYDVLAEVFGFVEQREAYCIRSRVVPHCALIANYTSNRYWDMGDFSTLGAAKMLIETHQQFSLFYNDDFPDLSAYSVVVLPETVRLNKASVESLRRFVGSGGLLIASGAALQTRDGDRFALSDVFGLEFQEYAPYRFAYLMPHDELWRGLAGIPQLLDGAFLKTVPTTAETLSLIRWPCGESVPPRAFRHPMPPPGDLSSHPAVTVNTYGKGKAVYMAAPIFGSYWDNNHHWLKTIVGNIIDLFDAEKPYAYDGGSPNVELTLTEKNKKCHLHIVNFQAGHAGNRKTSLYEPVERITPIHDLRIRLRMKKPDRVVLQPEGTALEPRENGAWTEITVPRVHIYSIVEIG